MTSITVSDGYFLTVVCSLLNG